MLESHSIPLIKNTTKMTSPGAVLSAWLAYALSIALALGILTYLFPWAMFHGDSIIFDFGDNAQHTSGWWYYAKDSWHFPLLHTSRVDHPEGISIAFTDSIPLAALFFKALMTVFPTWFPEHFHYFGWWIGFVFVTQALSATLLMRTLGAKSTFATVLVVLFVLTWPVIHVRYSHAALMLHSILLFGLALYFLGVQHKWRSSIVSAAFIVLHVISLLVHPYFLPFTFGLYFAFMVDQAIQKGDWARQLVRFFVLFAVLIAIALLMGYFGRSTYRGGYGEHYNFNLASPFCADLSKFYPCDIGIPAIAAFEGFNYLGLGLLLLLPIAFVLNWRHILLAPKRYPVLTLILVGMFAYSVTNYVSFGPHRLVYFPLPSWLDWVTGTFRAAGRFFWIIGYLALFLTIASLTKRKKWWLNLVLIAALGIQIVDVKPWLKQIKTLAAKPRALNYEAWTPLMAHIDKIVIYPTFECGRGDLHYYTWIMQLAGYHGKLLNSGYTSRDKKDCPNSELVIQEPLQTRHLYVLATVTYYETPFTKSFKFPTRLQEAIDRGECVKRNDGLMCLPGSKPEFWNNLSLNTYPAKFAENSMFLAGPELNTHIGVPQHQGFNANLVPKNPKQAGWLSFGPSLPLPVGEYKFSLTYLSQEKTTQSVGKWDVVLQQGSAGNEKILFSGDLSGTSGASKQIEGVLAVGESQANMPLDIRTFFLAQGDLELVSISLVKLP